MNNIMNVGIPVGTSSSNEIFELSFVPQNTMHYYISGSVGTGKTNLLRAIALNAAKKYSPKDVIVWTISNKLNEFIDLENKFPENIVNIDATSEEAVKRVFAKLENEVNNRINVMRENGWNFFYNHRTKIEIPQILILIDDYYFMGCVIEKFSDLKASFERIFTKANALGISFVLADQFPKCKSKGLSLATRDSITGLISINKFITEDLELTHNELSDAEERNITAGIRDFPGAFAFKCRVMGENQIGWAKSQFVPNETPTIHKTPHKDYFPLFGTKSTDYDISQFVNSLAKHCVANKEDYEKYIRRLNDLKEYVQEFDKDNIIKTQINNVLVELDKLQFVVQCEYKSACNSNNKSIVKDSGAPITEEELKKQMELLRSYGLLTDFTDEEQDLEESDIEKQIELLRSNGFFADTE